MSASTSSIEPGAILHVYRAHGNKLRRGEGYGRRFATTDDAFAWALEYGYLQPFVTAWCRHCRILHTFLGRKSGFCHQLGVFTGAAGQYDAKTGQVTR